MTTLAEVIAAELHDLDGYTAAQIAEDIAAAVLAHLSAPEMVERMARALAVYEGRLWAPVWRENNKHNAMARAAVAALTEGDK